MCDLFIKQITHSSDIKTQFVCNMFADRMVTEANAIIAFLLHETKLNIK